MSQDVGQIHPEVDIIFSTVADGSMSSGGGVASLPVHAANVSNFLKRHGFPDKQTRVYVTYNEQRSYVDIERVSKDNVGKYIVSDALYTTELDAVITLPVADCIATVVYDPVIKLLGVLHLGRHSSVAGLIEHFAVEAADRVGSDPRDWLVWMSPSLKKASDRMDYFTPAQTEEWQGFTEVRRDGIYIDIPGHNKARFIRAGVSEANIHISPIDTYTDRRYFSNRAANETADASRQGRMMVAARIRPVV